MMRFKEINEALKFLRPGELRGSYNRTQLLNLGFRETKGPNKQWYIDRAKWDDLVRRKLIY